VSTPCSMTWSERLSTPRDAHLAAGATFLNGVPSGD